MLNGEKSSISMADQAERARVFARTGRVADKAPAASAFLVPMKTPGVSTSRFKTRQQGGRPRLDLFRWS